MSIDLSPAAITAADLIDVLGEQLEDDASIDSESIEVGVVGVIVEVNYRGSDGEDYTALQYRCSDARRWVQSGLFQRVADTLRDT